MTDETTPTGDTAPTTETPAKPAADNTPDPTLMAEEAAELDKLSNSELIARRSADIDGDEAKAGEHVKVFVLPPGPKPTEANGYDHRANYAATRQYAIQQGLRPTGDVRFVSAKPFGPGKLSWALTYAMPAVPADRADYEPVTVVTDNETDETGHVPNTTGEAPEESDAGAK